MNGSDEAPRPRRRDHRGPPRPPRVVRYDCEYCDRVGLNIGGLRHCRPTGGAPARLFTSKCPVCKRSGVNDSGLDCAFCPRGNRPRAVRARAPRDRAPRVPR